ncbi:YHS/TRASH domain protein [Geotalea daltonii FRC-32]|uniref:YHS/TRASH domain protein n=1 Tax=Geotalea daltonii (strain DSM 22248 / JCM 15807 / FRC-32) TaxID=316067 RepID=B9M0R7_GEODF|nr:YHS domain-containing protein [Geotalea daltonii]ACM20920.1 YHS/TRASH domain protein [Geotalea daltonii FRC-32]
MVNETTLGEKITSRLQQHKRDLAKQQQQLDSRMKDLLEEREQLASVGKVWIEKVILPRLKELEKYFDNGKVEIMNLDSNLSCACEFAHTTRFPATVRLNISLLPGNGYLTARYDLTILPVLMEYTLTVEEKFSIESDEEALAIWVEDRIVDFIDTYLRLETHPLYQKDNTVVDIVCGMRIPSISATSKVERDGRIFYFCSEHCREAFIKQNN